jgi:hypothetical protein
MNVLGIRWLGVPAERYDEMVAFLRDGLGLAVEFEEEGTTELSLANGDRVQVFAPGHRYYELFGTGPVPLFEVDDVHAAVRELEQAGPRSWGQSSVTCIGSGRTSARPTETCMRLRR